MVHLGLRLHLGLHVMVFFFFFSKFVIFVGKYQKCQKKRKMYLINPIPGNPGTISRKSENEKIVGIPGIRERTCSQSVYAKQVIISLLVYASMLLDCRLTYMKNTKLTVKEREESQQCKRLPNPNAAIWDRWASARVLILDGIIHPFNPSPNSYLFF
jgi:hypothetical protein